MDTKKFLYADNLCLFRCLSLHRGALVRALTHMFQAFKTKLEEFTGMVKPKAVKIGKKRPAEDQQEQFEVNQPIKKQALVLW